MLRYKHRFLIGFVSYLLLAFCCSFNLIETINNEQTNLPYSDGCFEFVVAFAEWEGKSMGKKVIIEIVTDSIWVSELNSESESRKGEMIEKGILRKHDPGDWIICQHENDLLSEEIGGCSGGPTIIDFIEMKYWLC